MCEIRDAAIGEAERNGWKVHPLRGKVPLVEDWPNKASSDTEAVAAMFNAYPGANVGLHPGASDLVIFDEDSADARDEAEALGLLAVPTLRTITARGRHHFFRRGDRTLMPPLRVRHRQRVDGRTAALEVKCDGANVVIPPSIHPSGHQYLYENPEAKVAECPAVVWAMLCDLTRVIAPPPSLPAPAPIASDAGDTDARVRSYLERVGQRAEGDRDNTAYRVAAFLVRDLALNDATAWAYLVEWNRGNTPPLGGRDLRAKLKSAAKHGRRARGSGLAREYMGGPVRPLRRGVVHVGGITPMEIPR